MPPQVKTVFVEDTSPRESRIFPGNGKPGNIDFWYQHANNLERQVEGLLVRSDIATHRRIVNAGFKGVVRELLKELAKQNPNHPLSDKKYRQKLFNSFAQEESVAVNALNKRANPSYEFPKNPVPEEYEVE